MDAVLINDGEHASRQRWELSDFGCWIPGKVLLEGEPLDLLVLVGAVEAIEEGTLVGERYKLQLSEGLVLLVLIG